VENLNPEGYRILLERLDPDPEKAEKKLLELRRKLTAFLGKRGVNSSQIDELVDEIIDRVIEKLLEKGDEIEDVVKYALGVYKYVLLEYFRDFQDKLTKIVELDPDAKEVAQETTDYSFLDKLEKSESKDDEMKLDCLESCVKSICKTDEKREMFMTYYGEGASDDELDKEIRGRLAKKLGITLNALGTRISRLRDQIDDCVRDCVAKHFSPVTEM